MSRVTVDAEMLGKLNGLKEQLELRDEAGNLLAFVQPVEAHLLSIDLPGPDPFSDEQIAEALQTDDPGRPLADILRDLRGE